MKVIDWVWAGVAHGAQTVIAPIGRRWDKIAMARLTLVHLSAAAIASAVLAPPAQAQVLAPPPTPAPSGTGATTVPALRVQSLTPRVYFVEGELGPISQANRGFNSNAGFVVTGDGVVVFDVLGTPALGQALFQAIRKVTPLPIRHVVISHYHADHFYGLQAFADSGAQIWAGAAVREYLASDAPAARLAERRESLAPWVDQHSRVVPPTRLIDAETAFESGGLRFRLLPVGPAHTPEDLMMMVESEGVLFAGDLVFAGRVPFVGDADSRAWLAAIERLDALAPRMMVTGHGPMSRDARADLSMTRDYLRYVRQSMAAAVQEMMSFDEAYARTDWSRFSGLPAFEAANRRNAYNTFLLMEQEALRAR
ncbi:MAG: MBL fold metallo-hydrolase [Burkholderiaceae bacterium]|nr:MBL fold metallo-hydrolase [Burkholderiaceae bacterium]